MPVDRTLPAQEFIDGQCVAFTGFFETDQPTAHGSDDLRLAADDPAFGILRREIRDGQWASIGPDDVPDARSILLRHAALNTPYRTPSTERYSMPLKIWLNARVKGMQRAVSKRIEYPQAGHQGVVGDLMDVTSSSLMVRLPEVRTTSEPLMSTPSTMPVNDVEAPSRLPAESFARSDS